MEQNSSYSCFSFITLKDIYNKYLDVGFIFFPLFIFLLKDSCFTEFCCFLSNLNMNQPSVQFSRSVVSSCLWPHGLQHPRPLCPSPTPWSLLKLMPIESVMPFNHLILCCLLCLLPSIFPSISVFSNESVLRIRWPKYWSFSFSISPSNGYSGLISFRMDWLDLLAVQGTLKVFSNTTIQKHQFFGAQLPL